ncbi:MAG: hypothetical protein P1U89_04975 [Verrucomicrobiales bacterium]|nr:hypothetical protein [Verrucomicrobiales bacterium]
MFDPVQSPCGIRKDFSSHVGGIKAHQQRKASAEKSLRIPLPGFFGWAFLVSLLLSSAYAETAKPVDFGSEIYPVLKANCLSCHNSTKAKADLILESPQDMLKGGDSGPAIEPGNADVSLLYTTAAHIEEPVMPPPNNKAKAVDLTKAELALLKRWINEGARGEKVGTEAPKSWSLLTGAQPIYTSALTGDGRFAAVGRGQGVDIYDLRLGKYISRLRDPSLEHATAHRDIVQSIAFSRDGLLASGGFRVAKIWKRDEISPGQALSLPQDWAVSELSPDGKTIAVGLKDGCVALFDSADSAKAPAVFKAHTGEVTALAFSHDDKVIFSAAADKTVVRTEVAAPEKNKKLVVGVVPSALSVGGESRYVIVAGADGKITLCKGDLSAFDETTPSVDHLIEAQPVVGVEPIAGKSEFVVGFKNGTVVQISLDAANLKKAPVSVRKMSHGTAIQGIAVVGNRVASVGDSVVKLWNLDDGKLIAELALPDEKSDSIEALNRRVAVATRLKNYWSAKVPVEEKLWKAESEKAKSSGVEAAKAIREKEAKRVAYEQVKKQLPTAKEADLTKAEGEYKKAAQQLMTLTRNRDSAVRLSGDAFARQVAADAAAAEADALIAALKTEIEGLTKAIEEDRKKFSVVDLKFSPDGSTVVAQLKTGGLRLWSAKDGAWLEDFPTVSGVGGILFAKDDQIWISSDKRKLQTWNLPGKSWSLVKTIGNGIDASPFSDRVSALVFHPHGHQLLIGGGVPSRSGELSLRDTETWETINENRTAHDDSITSLAFSPDGEQIVSGGTDRQVKIFDRETLELVQTFEGHTSHVLDVDWNADGLTLASGSADRQVKIWNIAEGKQKSKVEGFQKDVTSVAFIAETEQLVAASGDKSLKQSNQPLSGAGKTFLHTAAISADGKTIIAAGEDSFLRVWDRTANKLRYEFSSPKAN